MGQNETRENKQTQGGFKRGHFESKKSKLRHFISPHAYHGLYFQLANNISIRFKLDLQ